jgi:hypothetical protein
MRGPRDPERVYRIIALIELIWGMYPDLRLGQILVDTMPSGLDGHDHYTDLYYLEDDLIEEYLADFVNKHPVSLA